MLGSRFCTSHELGSRHRARLARSLANNLTLTVLLVALFASFAIAASSSSWQPEYSRQFLGRVADRLANLDDRALVNDFNERAAQEEAEADDEQFLRRLKQAAEYLDGQLAGEPHERQPVSVEFANTVAAPFQAPRYELLDNADKSPNERLQYALPLEPLSGGASLPVGQEAGKLVESEADDNQAESETKANLMNYLLMIDRARELERKGGQQREEDEPAKTIVSLGDIGESLGARKRQEARETTLLEDEQADEQPQASRNSASAKPSSSVGAYAKVAHTSQEQLAGSAQHQESPSSMFGRLKANLSYYLPFLSQINILQRPKGEQAHSHPSEAGETGRQDQEKEEEERPTTRTKSDGSKKNDIGEQHDDKSSRLQSARQSVSTSKAIPAEPARHLRAKVNVSKSIGDQLDLSDDHEAESDGNVRIASASKRVSVSLADSEHDLGEMVATQQDQEMEQQQQPQQGSRSVSALRQSSLVFPLREELLVRGAPDEAGSERDSLLGRYIYAPTQHYHLSALPSRSQAGSGEQQQQQQQLKSAYAFQKEPGSLLSFAHLIERADASANKSAQPNDLYFLVMVGAFCVMAMAVVLAAGLFAYRVQQQRKASQDQDYPTYGVVGPNNMAGSGGVAGKSAGAAAFVNGYFNSPLSSAKSASAKHLPDLYGQAAAIDSGLEKSLSASISSGHKKNSSSTISSTRAANNEAAAPRATKGNNLFASTAANLDAARMYHYQHQKQQMIVSDRSSAGRHTSASDMDSDEGDDDGSYTVYECPGLASAHEMEIKNPLFSDDHSP